MIAIDDFQALKRRVDGLRQRAAQAAGAAQAATARLAEEFGAATLDAAKAKLAKLERRERAMSEEYAEAKAAFEAQYRDLLGG